MFRCFWGIVRACGFGILLFVMGCQGFYPQLNDYVLENSFEQSSIKWLALENANVVDVVSGKVTPSQRLLIHNGKIADVQAMSYKLSQQMVRIIDVKGAYVLPGLIDMHVHPYSRNALALALAHGVTHVRVMNGVEQHLQWRDELQKNLWLGSDMTVSSPIMEQDSPENPARPMTWGVSSPEQAKAFVELAKAQGFDLIKAYGGLSAENLQAVVKIANELAMPVAKHAPHPPRGAEWDLLQDMQSLEHMEDIFQGPLNFKQDDKALQAVIQKLVELNVPVTPTLSIFWQLTQISVQKQRFVSGLPEGYVSPIIAWEESHNQVQRWLQSSEEQARFNEHELAYLQNITRQLYQAGVPLLVGSDSGVLLAPHGLATLKEMSLMQDAGVPATSVVYAATLGAAKALGKSATMGSIEPGKKADLIVVQQNPLDDVNALSELNGVVKEGDWLPKSELESLISKARDEYNLLSELLLIMSNY
ncbi:amidohydrolase family protein [Paraneptunicella aestuarii]|uniref:amidohydrolase family protein n=1 Tax=Paraneptunicella aestuarii TaxID=2831148 RepID=UPI001E62453B|nr:amidohydrolase family protein [Paraneptunicella aestuarii]UAA37832.1 amidohydrolase family protein [Paraneptunicella aestuarii]